MRNQIKWCWIKHKKKNKKTQNEVFGGFKDFQRKSNNFPKSRKRNKKLDSQKLYFYKRQDKRPFKTKSNFIIWPERNI